MTAEFQRPSTTAPPAPYGYAFDGVVVELARGRVLVDGQDVKAGSLRLKLLCLLCRSPRLLITRDQLFDAIWPRQVVSDEALTKLIGRLRDALGPYGDLLVTVRGLGLRLDATVETLTSPPDSADDLADPPPDNNVVFLSKERAPGHEQAGAAVADADADAAASSATGSRDRTASAAAPLPAARGHRPYLRALIASALALALITAAVSAWFFATANRASTWIDPGYGIGSADLHADHAQTASIARAAFRADAEGDRPRAIQLLLTAHRSDLRTPIPALFLSQFTLSADDKRASQDWFGEAERRIAPLRDPYINLLRDYFAAENVDDYDGVMRASGALLDLRPEAWRMRVARAHMLMMRGMRAAALREAQAIHVRALDHRKIEMILADRATLGDGDGALAALARLPQDPGSPSLAFLHARIDYSRGRLDAARAGFARAVELGLAHNRLDLVVSGQRMAGLLAMTLGDEPDARVRLVDALHRLRDMKLRAEAADLELVVAQMEALHGRLDQARSAIANARALLAPEFAAGEFGIMTELFALRLLGAQSDSGIAVDEQSGEYTRHGVADLLAARRHQARGDAAAAAASLRAAVDAGVFDTGFRDEARLLADELSMPAPAERPIDPPYPPLARFATRWAHGRRATSVPPAADDARQSDDP